MESKRKRKRKTRAERNRLAHHLISSVDESLDKIQNKTHTRETGTSTLYPFQSLKPGKAVPCTMEVKKINRASITQGRLTRRVGLFASMQSSDLISREVDRGVGKNAEKISYELASGRTNTVNGIDDAGDHSLANNKSPHDSSADERDIMLIGSPPFCPSKDDMSASDGSKLKKDPSPSGSPAFAPASIGSAESSNTEEFLDPVIPFQEIADSISKDLKFKMARMFPSRNIEMEMCSELQKLIKQSSQKVPDPKHFQNISEKTFQHFNDASEERDRKKLEKVCESPPSSYLGHFPPALSRQTCATLQDGESFLPQQTFQASSLTHSPCDSTQPQVSLHLSSHPFSGIPSSEADYAFIDRSNFLRRTGKSEMARPKAIDIQIQKDEGSDEESMNAFLLARYHSFVLSSRELNAFQNLQHKDTIATESVNSAMDSVAWKCNYPCCAWQSHNNHNHHHHHHNQQSSCFIQDQDSNLPTSSSLGKYSSYKHRFKAPERHIPSHLDISRHRLKTALESVSTRCQTRPDFNSRQDFSMASTASFPSGKDPDFRQFLFQNDSSAHCSCPGPSLGQMKSHQTDLQYQARDFLDELENEFNQSHSRTSSERHSLLSDSVLYGGRQEEPNFTWKGSSTH